MALPSGFPDDLKARYESIKTRFNSIAGEWKSYNDQVIPEDREFAKEIIQFVIDAAAYILNNYETINKAEFHEFLANYPYNFYYGPQGDDKNYLDFEEEFDGELFSTIFWELYELEHFTKPRITSFRDKCIELLKSFNEPIPQNTQ